MGKKEVSMSLAPQIVSSYQPGEHNADLNKTNSRLKKDMSYKDLSCIQIVPAFGAIPTKVVAAWLNMYTPPNAKFVRLFAMGMEVGNAFSTCIESILAHPDLSTYKYVLTLEHDNIPPPDAIVKLLQCMEANPEYSVIGGLYHTKGAGGQPQIWGDPKDPVLNFRPQIPVPNTVQECCGTGMGFTAYRLAMFKDEKLRRPWFVTQTEGGVATQDLYFANDARKHGYRFAIDTSIKVGHYDLEGKFGPSDFTW
jgi:hypothetical protein